MKTFRTRPPLASTTPRATVWPARAVLALGFVLVCIGGGVAPGRELGSAVVPVVASRAECVAVSDRLSVLVIGHRGLTDRDLSLFRLGADGRLASPVPSTLELTRPESLIRHPSYPLAVAFHPLLPLLYVWQDINAPETETAVFEAFDHLLVYAVADGKATLSASFARGPEFAFALSKGALSLCADGSRLFMSNLRDPEKDVASIGYMDLDEHGLPKPVPVPIEGSLDGYGLNKFELRHMPTAIRVAHLGLGYPARGLFACSREVVLFAASQGLAFWDTANRRAPLGYYVVHGFSAGVAIGGTPLLPVVFGASVNGSSVFRMAQVEGYPSLLPQITEVPGARFESAPVAMPGLNGVAIGADGRVHLLPLDAAGRFAGPAEVLTVESTVVRAMAFSEEHRRLYVPVEATP